MDPWQLLSELCRRVVQDQNVYLDILVTNVGIEIMLMPLGKKDEEDE